mmetsp:Transcript_20306/g.22756  ORF Transcript_20306/g.22756 Transcript_20306/m.22756 type:complete len:458 (+) Transcript_20306:38-1411(+)|eukprot:CAMPEP_0195301104 /NCGR_PEP_ID=MMETSP0707-20130614/28701_1 /TAXON_ID=33640 /ORGANISM="Asterionellopsis glacialis, Strain CCMP134" /LENGTH=457 /DNA_ID=CAMNT_0040363959 /DNA_START=79 /DNA_END=1452 /DNA_ORIENTATION=+
MDTNFESPLQPPSRQKPRHKSRSGNRVANTIKSHTSKKERKKSEAIDDHSMIITMRDMGLTPPGSPALITPTPVKTSCGFEVAMENPVSTPSPFRRRLDTADTPLIHNLPEGTPHLQTHPHQNYLESRICSEDDDDHCSLVSSLSNDDSLRMKAQAQAAAAVVEVTSPPPTEVHVTIPDNRKKTPPVSGIRNADEQDREVHIPEWLEVELIEERDTSRLNKTPLVMKTRRTSVQEILPPKMSPNGTMNLGKVAHVSEGAGCLPPPPPRVKISPSPQIPRPSFGRSRTSPSMEFGSIYEATSTSITAGSSFSNSKGSAFDNISHSTPESRREPLHGSFNNVNFDGEDISAPLSKTDSLLGRRQHHRRTRSDLSGSTMTGPSIMTGGSIVSGSPRSQYGHAVGQCSGTSEATQYRRKKNVVTGEIKYVLGRMSAPLKKLPIVRGKSTDIDLKRSNGCMT